MTGEWSAALDDRDAPECPPGPACSRAASAAQAAHGFHRGLAVGKAPPVVAAARGVVAQLDDPGHVEHVVDPAVACAAEPVADVLAAGGVDRGGAGPGCEVAAAGEAADVADISQD